MTQQTLWPLVAAFLAVAVPVGVLWSASPAPARANGLVVTPFGLPQLLLAHLLAALPLSFLVAATVRERGQQTRLLVLVVACLLLAGFGVWASVTWGPQMGQAVGRDRATFLVRLLVRVGWCLLLQLPWCLLGRCLAKQPVRPLLGLPGWAKTALAVVAAAGPPAAYTLSLVEDQTRKINELVARSQWLRAQQLTIGLDDLSPDPAIDRTVRELQVVVRSPLPPNASAAVVVRRAGILAALGRLDDARQLARPLASIDPGAGLLLAAIDQDRERWAESRERYRAVLGQLKQMAPSDQVRLWRVEAYEGLADNARRQKDLAGAVAVYHEALAKVPEAEAYLHFQLGRQLHQDGRSVPALHHLEVAVRLEPQHYTEPARPLIRAIMQNTPGCLLNRSGTPPASADVVATRR